MPNRFIEPLILSVLAIVICICVFSLTRVHSDSNVSSVSNRASAEKDLPDGVAHEVEIIAGPFDLHRKYRSMEGPYANATF
jgi:hypothetical protein